MPSVDFQFSYGKCAVIAHVVARITQSVAREPFVNSHGVAEFFREQLIAAQSNARIFMIIGLPIDIVDRPLADGNQLLPDRSLLVTI